MNNIEEIKPNLPAYVQEITTKSKGKNQFVCPLCNSGAGANRTGAFTIYPETNSFHCFSCGANGDIFDLYAGVNHVDNAAAIRELSAKYGFTKAVSTSPAPEKNYTKFFAYAESQINQTDYLFRRGISANIQQHFHCGYIPDYKYSENQTTPAVIIPTSETSYMWRSTTGNEKRKKGTAHILNVVSLEQPFCFVVEGEIDCMSVVECGFPCIATGSTGNIKKIFEYKTSETVLIIAMDNDEPGRKASGELEKLCMENKTPFITVPELWKPCKDANELLLKDRSEMRKRLLKCAEQAAEIDHEEFFISAEEEEWGEPEPFSEPGKPEKFSLNSLPEGLRDYFTAVCEYVQIPYEMAVLPLLSVLALCVQNKAVVRHPANNHVQPLNLYTLTVAPPGSRKSGCMREFLRPVEEYQKEYNEKHAADIEKYKTELSFLEKQREEAIRRNNDLNAAKAIATKISALKPVNKMILNVNDTTPEALTAELSRQGESIGVIDDEGGIFDVLSGIYSNGQVNIDIFLKGYDGTPYKVLRCNKDNVILNRPLITVGLMTQPLHFQEAMENRKFSGRGFIHRFLFAFPESRTGELKMCSPDIPEELTESYRKLIFALLDMPKPDLLPVLQFDREAGNILTDYFYHLQHESRAENIFENYEEWVAKQFDKAMRIAGILHLCFNKPAEKISGGITACAVKIAKWAENHAVNALSGGASEPEEIKNARYIVQKLKKNDIRELTKHDFLLLCRPLKSKECEKPLELLSDMGYIRRERIERSSGNAKEIIRKNPKLCRSSKKFAKVHKTYEP